MSDADTSKSLDAVQILWGVLAFLFIGFGWCMIPVGLFVGPHILVAAAVHCLLGTGYALAICRMQQHPRRAFRLALVTSLTVTLLCAAGAVWELVSIGGPQAWSGIGVYFALVTLATFRASRQIPPAAQESGTVEKDTEVT